MVGWCKPIIMSNQQPSYFVLLLGWVAVAWLGFGVMTIADVFRINHRMLAVVARSKMCEKKLHKAVFVV